MSISVAIIEDNTLLRGSLETLVNGHRGLRCVAAFPNGEAALKQLPRIQPDVVLMDINLPGMNGVECVRALKEALPRVQVVMLTVYDDSEQIFQALENGASGYLLKRTPMPEILQAIEDVHRGGAPMSSNIARKVVQSFQRRGQSARDSENLTPREVEALQLVSKGYINKEIADQLGISLETVRSHLKSIYEKLHVRSRTEAAMKFFRE
jgi:DNA-binding NarL/FixJ family response regulator